MNKFKLRLIVIAIFLLSLQQAIAGDKKDKEIKKTESACIEILSGPVQGRSQFVDKIWSKYSTATSGDKKDIFQKLNSYFSDELLFAEGRKSKLEIEFSSPAGVLRRKLIALMNIEKTRYELVEAARQELQDRSAKTLQALKAGELLYDVVIRGGGVHDLIAINGFTGSQKINLNRVLTVEQEPIYANTFAGRRFLMNSSLGPTKYGRRQIPGERENLNYIPGGLIQLTHFVDGRYPYSTDLGDLLTVLRALSPAPIVFGQAADVVAFSQSSREFEVKIGSIRARAKAVLNVTGLGDEKLSSSIELGAGAQELVAQKKIQIASAFLERSSSSETPYREFVGKTISVTGGGNSADNVVEWLVRALDGLKYGRDNAAIGFPKKIIWHNPRFPQGLSQENCATYTEMTRVRYCAIAAAIKSGLVKVVRGRVQSFEASNRAGRIKVNDDTGKTYRVDYAVAAIGYEDNASASLKFGEVIEETESSSSRSFYVKSPIESKDGEMGKVLLFRGKDKVPFYFAGTSAKIKLTQEELAGVSQNSVAIFLLGPKTYLLANEIAEEIK